MTKEKGGTFIFFVDISIINDWRDLYFQPMVSQKMKSKSFLFFTLIGVLLLLLGANFIFGFQTLPISSDSSCRAICGLGLLLSIPFGPKVGAYAVGLIWSAIGISLLTLAYRFSR